MTDTDVNPFGDGFDAPPSSRRQAQTDRWGRYIDLPAIPGVWAPQPCTRVTTVARVLKDEFLLEMWKKRQLLIAVRDNPDMLEPLRHHRFNHTSTHGKRRMNDLIEELMELSGSWDGATAGTRFHELADKYDREELDLSELKELDLEMLDFYRRTLAQQQITILPEYSERVVLLPAQGVAGRIDRIVRDIDNKLRIGDLKSNKTLDFSDMEFGIQLGCYSNASWILDEDAWEWEPMPELATDRAVVIWVPTEYPSEGGIHDVNIRRGWRMAQGAIMVRDWRKERLVTRRPAR